MKRLLIVPVMALAAATAFAQPAASSKAASGAKSSEQVSATCKDGTPYTGESLKGACSGHGGVDKSASARSSTSGKGSSASASAQAGAAAGGPGKVWANESTKVYHCPGDRYYGKTKKGEYMSEADARSKGFHPDHGKACATS